MRLTKVGSAEVFLSYFAIEVTYTEAEEITNNAIFFGTNF